MPESNTQTVRVWPTPHVIPGSKTHATCIKWRTIIIRESIISENFGFAISVCRLRERGRIYMSKSVYVRVFNDLELLRCSSLCD